MAQACRSRISPTTTKTRLTSNKQLFHPRGSVHHEDEDDDDDEEEYLQRLFFAIVSAKASSQTTTPTNTACHSSTFISLTSDKRHLVLLRPHRSNGGADERHEQTAT